MLVPGVNVLNIAMAVLGKTTLTYYKYIGRTLNSVGNYVPSYEDPNNITGSFQPVKQNMYKQYGLDFQKVYYNLYTSTDVLDITRNVSTDVVVFNGSYFQLTSAIDWQSIDGWTSVICVKIAGFPT